MGYRAHVCTTYQVQYGGGSFSAGACGPVNALLLGYEYTGMDGVRRGIVEYCDSEETVMELSREGLESLVLALEKGGYGAGEVGRLAEAGYTTEHLAGVLQGWLDSADRSNGFIRIEWF